MGTIEPRPLFSAFVGGLIAWGTAIAGIAVVDVIVRQILMEDVRTYLERTAAGTAALIDGDQLRTFNDPKLDGKPDYNRASRPLRALLDTNPSRDLQSVDPTIACPLSRSDNRAHSMPVAARRSAALL